MEHQSESLINYVPSFVRGCNLLLIHDSTLSLIYLSSLLEQYSFKVTAIDNTSAAASMIYENEGRFKLIMAKANMPAHNIDALAFQNHIPLVFILSGEVEDVNGKALAKGSCYFLREPIGLDDLKSLWQHMYHSKPYSPQNADFRGNQYCNGKVLHNSNTKQDLGANGDGGEEVGKLKWKRGVDDHIHSRVVQWPVQRVVNGTPRKVKEMRKVDNNNRISRKSFQKMELINERVWTPELHQKFKQALSVLGDNHARPRGILRRMNEPYLTVRQVASHLQKYKMRLKYKENGNNDLPPARTSSSSGTKYDFLASSTCLNMSQNQMNNATTQHYFVPEVNKLLETAPYSPTYPIYQLTNNGGQSLASTVEHPVPSDSMRQDQPETAFDCLFKMLVEDSDNLELFGDGTNLDEQVTQYSEMLKTVLDGDNPNIS